ncbi:hypothetical protein OOK58_09425 [Streptomyces sp. NBC_01728]|uniref:hypothetical protein n=1 Tax=unclassified Streptomyces TaxID=2593676 RepID=UPI002259E37C|nr:MULTISPECIES: hypothetical protein [unclassified Streptomyces]MCX4452332.1 hypothetical protein [Streptomyces sp. NBC_01719]MCX4491692.1 hypothetical protein [Streptomyces sp. NBC_01728]
MSGVCWRWCGGPRGGWIRLSESGTGPWLPPGTRRCRSGRPPRRRGCRRPGCIQLTQGADLDALDTALGLLLAAGWPTPEDPDGSDDEELSGRGSIAERLQDEVAWVRQCSEWIDHLDSKPYPPAANLRPKGDFPDSSIALDGIHGSAC